MRKIIYLKRIEKGMVVPDDSGFARIERKNGGIRVYVCVCGLAKEEKQPVYLVYEYEGERYAEYVGGLMGESETEFVSDSLLALKKTEFRHIGGVLVGDKGNYMVGACDSDVGDFRYETISFTETVSDSGKEAGQTSETVAEEPVGRAMDSDSALLRAEYLKDLREMYPFEDDEMEWCVQMEPADLFQFPMKYWHFAKNSFLLEGFYNYRHLLYAHKGDCEYIGVPGQFHRRERYLAGQFGFPMFKGTKKKRLTNGDYGYWLCEMPGR